jgi:hypothetical protein
MRSFAVTSYDNEPPSSTKVWRISWLPKLQLAFQERPSSIELAIIRLLQNFGQN